MKKLKVALICKNESNTKRNDRAMGYFSYDVPEFEWTHLLPGKNFTINWNDFKHQRFDFVFHEDYPYGAIRNLDIPYVFLSIDSTLSDAHYRARFEQARTANLVLVDHDNVNRFFNVTHKVYQFPYCVNDKVFYRTDDHKYRDIVYHCSATAHAGIDERKRIRRLLHDLSTKHNWSYKSGVLPLDQYATSMRHAKIVVNQSRTPNNRPHRIFDAMACGAMVLTSKLPRIDSDGLFNSEQDWKHIEYLDDFDLEDSLDRALNGKPVNMLNFVADNGYNLVMQNHTWSIRARQLREIINKEFGI